MPETRTYALNTSLMDLRGRPIYTEQDGKRVELTSADACIIALLDHPALDADGKPRTMTGVEKFGRWRIAEKIASAKENDCAAELTAQDVETLKQVVGDVFTPAVVGAVWTILDGETIDTSA